MDVNTFGIVWSLFGLIIGIALVVPEMFKDRRKHNRGQLVYAAPHITFDLLLILFTVIGWPVSLYKFVNWGELWNTRLSTA